MSTAPGGTEGVERKDQTEDAGTIGMSADTTAPAASVTTTCARTSLTLIGLPAVALRWMLRLFAAVGKVLSCLVTAQYHKLLSLSLKDGVEPSQRPLWANFRGLSPRPH